MTEYSGETCVECGKPIVEEHVVYRQQIGSKIFNPDGTEQPGNPLSFDMAAFCPTCAADYDNFD